MLFRFLHFPAYGYFQFSVNYFERKLKPFALELESIRLAISNFFSVSSESLKQRGLTVYDNEFEIKEHTEL